MMQMNNNGMDGRRLCLQSPTFEKMPEIAHAGLWIDKFLAWQEKGGGAKKADHLRNAVQRVNSPYAMFYTRWDESLKKIGAQTRRADVLGRLSIGLGNESVLETSISLHRTYGVPYIPGSALKGLAARYARKRLDNWSAEYSKVLFGDTDVAGFVTFFDALYIPGSANANTPLALDVMNVHHPEYYRGEKDAAPADWDSPTPISFVSATGSYLLALCGPNEWVDAAFKILALALKEEGIGAKTSSGYGRMEIEGFSTQATSSPQASAVPQLAPAQSARPSTHHTATGKVRYESGKPVVRSEEGNRWRVNWKELGMDALKEKTLVEIEYDEFEDGMYKVVRVTKKGE
jgi:CRISPR-associated protein Cmr6